MKMKTKRGWGQKRGGVVVKIAAEFCEERKRNDEMDAKRKRKLKGKN